MAQLVLGTKEGYKISNLVGTTKSRREWKGLKDETALGKYLETIRSKGLDERRDALNRVIQGAKGRERRRLERCLSEFPNSFDLEKIEESVNREESSMGGNETRYKIEIEVETMPIGELDLVRVEPFSVTEGEIYNNRDEMLAKEASSLADRRGFSFVGISTENIPIKRDCSYARDLIYFAQMYARRIQDNS